MNVKPRKKDVERTYPVVSSECFISANILNELRPGIGDYTFLQTLCETMYRKFISRFNFTSKTVTPSLYSR